jgi:dTDP-4-amino-4,6-dideoxygalactose transaminase
VLNTPFSPWPSFSDDEVAKVAAVLASNRVNYWTGTEGRDFEREFAAWTGARHAVAVANGTVALDLALKALGIGAGDEVIVSPRSFMASVSCVVTAGAVPVFADVDRDSGNITAASIERVLTPRARAIICVHLAGWPCDMTGIMALAEARGLKVIEDCAQAHGAMHRGRSVGTWGHIGAWSFCQDKIMTTAGEGGMVTTNDRGLWESMWSYKDHGKTWESVYERQHAPGFRWLHDRFGTNWRMLEVQAAVGRLQLGRMPDWSAMRARHAETLASAVRGLSSVRYPALRCATSCPLACASDSGCRHANYKFYAYVEPEALAAGWTRDRVVSEITALGVPCYQGSCSEIYRERAFDHTGWRPAEPLPVAQELGHTSLMLLVHPTLTDGEIDQSASALKTVLARAQR